MKYSLARRELDRGLPPVLLLSGPGALLLARDTWERYGLSGLEVPSLTAEAARTVVREAHVLPAQGAFRDFLICIDKAPGQAQDILLKVLEEPPAGCRFILAGQDRPARTVESRCRLLTVGLPGTARPSEGPELARLRGKVASAIKAARSGDPDRLSQAVRGWLPEHTAQLDLWATEAASGRWDRFTPDFAPGVTSGRALTLKSRLRAHHGSRLAALIALEKAFPPDSGRR